MQEKTERTGMERRINNQSLNINEEQLKLVKLIYDFFILLAILTKHCAH